MKKLNSSISAQIENAVLQKIPGTQPFEQLEVNLADQPIENLNEITEEQPLDSIDGSPTHKDAWFPINVTLPGNQTAQQQQAALELQRRRQNMLIGGGVLLALMVILVIILKMK